MSTQPEALRLASRCKLFAGTGGKMESAFISKNLLKQAAAEMRRLHAANLDCVEHFNAVKAERDELLGALKSTTVKAASGRNIACTCGVMNNQPKTKEAYEAQKQIARANARLIAAAPELLAALTEIVSQIDQGGAGGKVFSRDACIAQARAAIAKAEGGAE